MKRSLKAVLLPLTAACLTIAAACGGSAPTPEGGQAPARGLKIAMIAKSSTNPVFLSARTGAEAAAKELSAAHNIPIEIAWLTPPAEDNPQRRLFG